MRRVMIGLTAVMLFTAACGGGDGVELATQSSPTVTPGEPTAEPEPEPTAAPELGEGVGTDPAVGTYGSDPYLDGLHDQCGAGDMDACDTLFADSPFDSEYEAFGGSCGGQFDEIVTQYCGVGPSADVPPELLDVDPGQWLDGYSEDVGDNFLEACLANAGESQQDFCECTWNSLATSVPFTDFVLFDRDTSQMTVGIEEALAACGF